MDKVEVFFQISMMTALFAAVATFGYEMVFISEAYLKALGI